MLKRLAFGLFVAVGVFALNILRGLMTGDFDGFIAVAGSVGGGIGGFWAYKYVLETNRDFSQYSQETNRKPRRNRQSHDRHARRPRDKS